MTSVVVIVTAILTLIVMTTTDISKA